jgi:hypothetical protein
MRWWIRVYLVFAAVQGIGIGLTGMVLPPEMQIPLRLTPLNTRFVAALYLAGGVGVLWAAFSRRRDESRLFVLGFGLATGMILILTMLHWSDFMGDDLPHRPVWIFVYVADPLLALLIVPIASLWPRLRGSRHRLTPLFLVEAATFGVLGLALLVLPDQVAAGWPWTLPPLAGQLYACFFVTFAVGAIFAARESETRAIRGYTLSSVLLMALVLLASLLHLDRFKSEPVSWIWFASFGFGLCAFALAMYAGHDGAWLGRRETAVR